MGRQNFHRQKLKKPNHQFILNLNTPSGRIFFKQNCEECKKEPHEIIDFQKEKIRRLLEKQKSRQESREAKAREIKEMKEKYTVINRKFQTLHEYLTDFTTGIVGENNNKKHLVLNELVDLEKLDDSLGLKSVIALQDIFEGDFELFLKVKSQIQFLYNEVSPKAVKILLETGSESSAKYKEIIYLINDIVSLTQLSKEEVFTILVNFIAKYIAEFGRKSLTRPIFVKYAEDSLKNGEEMAINNLRIIGVLKLNEDQLDYVKKYGKRATVNGITQSDLLSFAAETSYNDEKINKVLDLNDEYVGGFKYFIGLKSILNENFDEIYNKINKVLEEIPSIGNIENNLKSIVIEINKKLLIGSMKGLSNKEKEEIKKLELKKQTLENTIKEKKDIVESLDILVDKIKIDLDNGVVKCLDEYKLKTISEIKKNSDDESRKIYKKFYKSFSDVLSKEEFDFIYGLVKYKTKKSRKLNKLLELKNISLFAFNSILELKDLYTANYSNLDFIRSSFLRILKRKGGKRIIETIVLNKEMFGSNFVTFEKYMKQI